MEVAQEKWSVSPVPRKEISHTNYKIYRDNQNYSHVKKEPEFQNSPKKYK
jgi:hypothetical protein